MRNKRVKIAACIIGVITIIVFIVVLSKQFGKNNVKFDELKNELTNNNVIELKEMDLQEIENLFGFYSTDIKEGIYLMEEVEEIETNEETEDYEENSLEINYPKEMVIFINKTEMSDNEFEEYSILVKGMQESVKVNAEDNELTEAYTNAIYKKTDNYFYLIVGSKNEELLKIIKKYT